jgi:DNA-binding NarL/FixJ family response regulator
MGPAFHGQVRTVIHVAPHLPISVLLAHPVGVVREQMASRLGREPDDAVVDAVGTVAEVLQRSGRRRYDVVVVARSLGQCGLTGMVGAVRGTVDGLPVHGDRPLRFVALVEDGDAPGVAEAIRAGVDAVATADELDVGFLDGVRAAARAGACVLTGAAATHLAAGYPTEVEERLSSREREVLDALALGLTNAEIAAKLYVSRETVKSHVAHLLRKLEVTDRHAAVRAARRLGLVTPDATDGSEDRVSGAPADGRDRLRSVGSLLPEAAAG